MGRLRRKRGRPSNYRNFLRDNPYWEKVKRKVKIRDNFQCVICSKKTGLEVHHITYKIGPIKIVGRELEFLKWVVTLCEECHDDQHFVPNTPFNPRNPKKMNIDEFLASNIPNKTA